MIFTKVNITGVRNSETMVGDNPGFPKKINYFKHDAFEVTVLGSRINSEGRREWTVSFDNKIEVFKGDIENHEELVGRLVQIVPLNLSKRWILEFYNEWPSDDTFTKKISDVLKSTEEREECSVFIHKDFFKVMEELEVVDATRFLDNFIEKLIKKSFEKKYTKAEIANKLETIFLEFNTLTDYKVQQYINNPMISQILVLLLLDYILTDSIRGTYNTGKNFKFYQEFIYTLSRDMFYQTKIDNVLGVLNTNKSEMGPMGWLVMAAIEEDKERNNPLYKIEVIGHKDSERYRVVKEIGNILFSKYMEKPFFDQKTYGENFSGLSENQVSQSTGLYLTNQPTTIASLNPAVDLQGNAIDSVQVNQSNLRTMNYRKIANRIDQLEDEASVIENLEQKESLLETAKFIINDIFDIQQQDENNYPEMNVLLEKVQEVITNINNAIIGEETIPSGEGVVGDIAKEVGKHIMKFPTAIVDGFKSITAALNMDFLSDRDKSNKKFMGDRPLRAKRFFMRIEELTDKILPDAIKIGPIVLEADKMKNQAMMAKANMKNRWMQAYDKRREERGYDTKRLAESYIEDFLHYKDMVVSSEDFQDVVKGTKRTVSATKNAWRIIAMKKAFREAKIALKYLLDHTNPEEYDTRRVAMDHIEYWEELAERFEAENNEESTKMAKAIRKEMNAFKDKFRGRIKFNKGLGEFMSVSKSDKEEEDYYNEDGEDPREKVEEIVENDYSDEEEKEEAVDELEEKILDKLADKGAISKDEADEAMGENVFDVWRLNKMSDRVDDKYKEKLSARVKKANDDYEAAKAKGDEKQMISTFKKKARLDGYQTFLGAFPAHKLRQLIKERGKVFIVFYKGSSNFSKLINYWTDSAFTHVDFIIDGSIYGVVEGGSGRHDIKHGNDVEVVVFELDPKVKKEMIQEYLKQEEGKGYWAWGVFKAQVLQLSSKKKELFTKWYCSQFAAAAIDYATDKKLKFRGKALLDYGYDWFAPQDVFELVQSCGLVKNPVKL